MSFLIIPSSDNAAIADFLLALRKRSRALKGKFRLMSCDKVIDRADGTTREKVELKLQKTRSSKSLTIRTHFWDDRWVWIDAREASGGGWKWEWTNDGRLAGNQSGRELVALIEQSEGSFGRNQGLNEGELSDIWRGVLLKGPRRDL